MSHRKIVYTQPVRARLKHGLCKGPIELRTKIMEIGIQEATYKGKCLRNIGVKSATYRIESSGSVYTKDFNI